MNNTSGNGGQAGAGAAGAAGSQAGAGTAGSDAGAGQGGSASGSGGQAGGDAGSAGSAASAGAEQGGSGGESGGDAGSGGQAGQGGSEAGGAAGQAGSEAGGEAGQGGSEAGGEAGSAQAGDGGASGSGAGGASGSGAGGAEAAGAGQGGSDPAGGGQGGGAGAAGSAGSDGSVGGSAGSAGSAGGQGGPNLAFVTSTEFVPTSSAKGADDVCAKLAEQAGLPAGKYVAWLSTSKQAARDKLAGARGWKRVDGLPFVDRVDDLIAGRILYPLRVDETGATVAQGSRVATGTAPDGTAALTCNDWSDSAQEHFTGDAPSGSGTWTQRYQASCAEKARFYCFQVDHSVAVQPPPMPASVRHIFITQKPFPVAGGLAAADLLCKTDALAAGLSGAYVALLATKGTAAADRVKKDSRDWFRLDGVRVADSKALLGAAFNDLVAPPNVTADGKGYLTASAWTGDSSPQTTSKLTCNDWVNANGSTFRGDSGPTDSTWFSGGTTSCDAADNHLRCVEQ